VTRGEGIVRGVGYALGFKNCGMPEGIEDYATASVTLRARRGQVEAEVHSAAAELGQGVTAIQVQIVREELGVDAVMVRPADTRIGSAGTSSASRQTYMTGGAVRAACTALRERLRWVTNEKYGHRHPQLLDDPDSFVLAEGQVRTAAGEVIVDLGDLLGDTVLTEESVFRPKPTQRLDPETGQGDAHLQFIYAGHRAVVDVDVETGMVSIVELTCAQDVGKAMNRQAVAGQMEGGTVQGVGLALMEELRSREGRIQNASFTDYLIPTTLDVPRIDTEILEIPDPEAPYGLKGAGEPSAISSAPAIVAAIRDACGRRLERIPVRPDDIVGLTADVTEPDRRPQ
jgi:CO/xanthine dehydrogenase Mo-binding subunit